VAHALRLLLLASVLALMPGCVSGCPDALLEGVLMGRDGTLVVEHADGFVAPVRWSASNHRVEERDGTLVVVDWLGIVKAREGDTVRLGGGETDGEFQQCGMFEVDPAG
jgi:hypothetical protein